MHSKKYTFCHNSKIFIYIYKMKSKVHAWSSLLFPYNLKFSIVSLFKILIATPLNSHHGSLQWTTSCSLKNTRTEFLSLGTLSILGPITFYWEGPPALYQVWSSPPTVPPQRHSKHWATVWDAFAFCHTHGSAAGFAGRGCVEFLNTSVHRQLFEQRISLRMSVVPSVISTGLQWS